MMPDSKARNREFKQLAGQIDVAWHEKAIMQIDADLVRIDGAITTTRDRMSLIGRLLNDSGTSNAQELARRLLDGAEPQEAVVTLPNKDDLSAEKDQLQAALVELSHTKRDKQMERSAAVSSITRDLTSALAPIFEHYCDEARQAADRLQESYAALAQISRCGHRSDHMIEPIREAVVAARADGGPIKRSSDPTVPKEVIAAIQHLQALGLPMKNALPKTIPV